jgi:hypothetical protein
VLSFTATGARERRSWDARAARRGADYARRRSRAGRAGMASAGCAWSTSALGPTHGGLRAGVLSVTAGTLNERALLDRIVSCARGCGDERPPSRVVRVLTAAPLLAA